MNIPSNEMLYEDLDYGAYVLYHESILYNENVRYAAAEFNKLYIRRVRLPEGKGNVIYLLSDTFENSLNMVNGKTFITPPNYRKFFYPWVSFGSFMGRRYKYNLSSQKISRMELVRDKTKLSTYLTRALQNTRENVFFSVADLFENIQPIMQRYPIKRLYTEFYQQFNEIIEKMTPPPAKEVENKAWNNRILIIDADRFQFKNGSSINDNKTNPLFLIYLAFFRTRDLSKLNIDRDILITSKNMFLKFNPAKTPGKLWPKFRLALFKIMKANLDEYTKGLPDDEQQEISQTSNEYKKQSIINNTIAPFTKIVSQGTKGVLVNAIDTSLSQTIETRKADKIIKNNQGNRNNIPIKKSIFNQNMEFSPDKYTPIHSSLIKKQGIISDELYIDNDEESDEIDDDVEDIEIDDIEEETPVDEEDLPDEIMDIINDKDVLEEVFDEIQTKIVPMDDPKNSPVNSARDAKLRKQQKTITVNNSTIEEILKRESSNVPIYSENTSAIVTSSNTNMHEITFANFDKTYINELYAKDIVACFDSLKDKEHPFYITNINVEDTSNPLDLKETWTVSLVDENDKNHKVVVDIPKFYQDRFMILGGNKYIILKQNLYNPLVKDSQNTVILTTNYQKITIERRSVKSFAVIEKIFSFQRKYKDNTIFTVGNSSKGNRKYISTLEYDELSSRIFKYKSGKCEIYFSHDYIREHLHDKIPSDIKGNEFYIGTENKVPILINEDTGTDRSGRSIAEIIEQNLSDENKAIFNSISAPTQPVFAEGKIAGQWIPIAVILIVWVGITKMLNVMGIEWKFHPGVRNTPKKSNNHFIKFADGILEYQPQMFSEMILNGLTVLKPYKSKMNFADLDTDKGYTDYIYAKWGTYKGILEIKTFYEFLIDPITKEVCMDLLLPTEPDGLIIHAVKLLVDNASTVSKASDLSYRLRSVEMIPAILYFALASQYKQYANSGGRIPMTLKQRVVITKVMAEKSVDEYSTLNPAVEVGKFHTVSTRGYKGSNSDYSYDKEKRSYDPSAVGKLAISTSADANVGITRELVVEPTLLNARGYRDRTCLKDPDTLKDVNIFSPVELLTPGTARNEDPIRTAIANKQSQHLVPVEDASPALISNGFDEALQFHLSNDFVINAEEDGKVIEINEEIGFIVVQYKSGKNFVINTKPEVVKNSSNGFFLSNQLKPTLTKVGQSFKKNEVLSYHDKYFKYSKLNGLRYAIGPLVKMAFISTYNTYEDAGICTETLSEKMKTNIVYMQTGAFKKESSIISIVKVGDKVDIGDALIRYDRSTGDDTLDKFKQGLQQQEMKDMFDEEIRNEVKASHAGTVVDIKIYSIHDPSNLSPSLRKIVQDYFDKTNNKKDFLNRYDSSPGIIKAGYLLTDTSDPVVNKYNTIKGKYKGIDVLIEIFIENSDVLGVGDKIALYSANKQIISEIIPKGYEPYSEFRPDEEIGVITSPGTIARRMTSSVIAISSAMKVMIELKRKISSMIKYT